MNPTTWRDHLILARSCAVGAGLPAFSYLALSRTIPFWLAAVAILITVVAHGRWLARLPSLPPPGPLSTAERIGQTTMAIATSALAVLAISLHVPVIAAVTVSVTIFASACARQRREIAATAAAAVGIALLVLGGEPPLLGIPLLLLTWALGLSTLVLVAGLTHAERMGIDARIAQVPGGARRTLAQVRRPLAFSAVFGLAALLINPPSGSSAGGGTSGLLGGRGPAVGATYSSGPMNLNARGELGSEPVAAVPATSPAHWRAGILTRYDGRTFTATRATLDRRSGRTAQGAAQVAGLMANGAIAATASTVSYQVTPLSAAPVIAPDRLVNVSIDPGALRLLPGAQLIAPTWQDPYTVVTATGAGADQPVDEAWLALPGTVTARTRALARELTQDHNGVPEKVAAIHDYLVRNHSYNLGAPRAPEGRDAVDHFLFDSRSGFCQHFAAAQTVLLRAAGVPARVATGFAFGSPDPKDPFRRILTQKDSHAWTEVLVPGRGWVISDATPAADAQSRSLENRIQTAYTHLMQDRQRRMVAGAALIAATVIGWSVALLVGRYRGRHNRPSRTPLEQAVDRLAAAAGGSPPDETLREVASRVPGAASGLDVVERGLYSPQGASSQETEQAIKVLHEEAVRLEQQAASQRPHRRRRRTGVI